MEIKAKSQESQAVSFILFSVALLLQPYLMHCASEMFAYEEMMLLISIRPS